MKHICTTNNPPLSLSLPLSLCLKIVTSTQTQSNPTSQLSQPSFSSLNHHSSTFYNVPVEYSPIVPMPDSGHIWSGWDNHHYAICIGVVVRIWYPKWLGLFVWPIRSQWIGGRRDGQQTWMTFRYRLRVCIPCVVCWPICQDCGRLIVNVREIKKV